ncbi:hypothetical protein OMAG_001717 [Candidatus Omnitrophus magneticus]|uniref:Uncharacterized protein n=1 Tax=Candidatus Omnitrophus magneticus TaxID=1609969 RepID=A0A0F0CSJ2_9BACT|nr:hypothetical protein OMAG_001717 [Candidatus Omnitrophus magneticus]
MEDNSLRRWSNIPSIFSSICFLKFLSIQLIPFCYKRTYFFAHYHFS